MLAGHEEIPTDDDYDSNWTEDGESLDRNGSEKVYFIRKQDKGNNERRKNSSRKEKEADREVIIEEKSTTSVKL